MSDLLWVIDVSNFQPRDLSGIIAEHRPQGGIVRLNVPAWEPIPDGITQDQVQSFRSHGLPVNVYGFARSDIDPIRCFNAWIDLCARMALVSARLWIDCEIITDRYGNVLDHGPDAAWLRKVRDHARALETPIGLYTGKWWVDDHFPGGWGAFREFNDLPAWVSEYDITPGLENVNRVWRDYGFRVIGHQWSGDPIDRSVMLPEAVTAPTPAPPEIHLSDGTRLAMLRKTLEGWRDRKPFRAITKKQIVEALNAGS